MGDVRGFMKHKRAYVPKEPVAERVTHYREFLKILSTEEIGQLQKENVIF